jgi:hypothetical protein
MPLHEEYFKKIVKFISVSDLKAFVCKNPGFRAFLQAACGSGGEQLTLFSNTKFEKSLTHPPCYKFKMSSLVNN